MSDIKIAVDSLVVRQRHYDFADSYYEGTMPEVFQSSKWAYLFSRALEANRLNFSRTVVDAVNNRLALAAIQADTPEATTAISEMFEENEIDLEQMEIHRKALTYGECYVLVWPDEDGDVQITYNSPKQAIIVYDPENGRKKLFGAKTWVEGSTTGYQFVPANNQRTRLNLYYPDRIEKYYRPGNMLSNDPSGQPDIMLMGENVSWTLISVEENPFGEIPMFHFRTQRPYGRPEHQDAWAAQDMINKLVANHMTTIDYQGAPQRYALTAAGSDVEADAFEDDEADRENIDSLKNGPGELWYLKGVNQVGQFNPADYNQFTEPIVKYVYSMASITSTPLHYFQDIARIPSGEALRVAEAPFTKKVTDRQASFGSTWGELFKFALKIEGITDVILTLKWKEMESIDSLDTWEVAIKKRAVGVPFEQVLLEMGYEPKLAKKLAKQAEKVAAGPATPGSPDGSTNPVAGELGMNAHNLAMHQQALNAKTTSQNDNNSAPTPAPDSAAK